MKLPEIVRVVGHVDGSRVVFLEDYVLQYLELCKEGMEQGEGELVLYGEMEEKGGECVCVVYGAGEGVGDEERLVAVGYVDMKMWKRGGDCSGIYLKCSGGQAVRGYYVFYDGNEGMKERLGRYYNERREKKSGEEEGREGKEEKERKGTKLPELVALSSRQEKEALSPYFGIRIMVMGILIVFSAIAVTTIDNYDKLNDFVQTAVHAGKILEEP